MNKTRVPLLGGFFLFLLLPVAYSFDLTPATIPIDEINSGGPPKDGIPALLKPHFVSVKEASFLKEEDRVVGFRVGQSAKAYPIRILNWHEIVNDTVGGKKIVVSYCPLCGTAMIFAADMKDKSYTFGVSGLLYNSDVLMYDHQTESLWSQIKMEAVTGKLAGTPLRLLPSQVTTWKDWKKRFPKSQVLSLKTGYYRDYDQDPYAGYESSKSLFFPVKNEDTTRHPKDWVFGLVVGKSSKAYPYKELAKARSPLNDEFAGKKIRIFFDKKNQSVRAETLQGQSIPGLSAYWFAWQAFYPNSAIFKN